MKKFGTVLIAIGLICLMSAVGNNDFADASGTYYPMHDLLAWMIGGFSCLGAGALIRLAVRDR